MNSTCTLANMQSDIDKIILGNFTTVNDFSSGCDKTNSSLVGTYPTGTPYNRVNATTFTYSKTHGDATTGKTHYFRLAFDATQLTTLTLAQNYTSGTDTLVNAGVAQTMNLPVFVYNTTAPRGLDIIVNKYSVVFLHANGTYKGIFDMAHSSTTRAFTNSILMGIYDLQRAPIFSTSDGYYVPYLYNFSTAAYASFNFGLYGNKSTKIINTTTGNQQLFENPVMTNVNGTPQTQNAVYNIFQIPANTFAGLQLFKDTNNLWRVTFNDISVLVD